MNTNLYSVWLFLVGAGGSGADLKAFTHARLVAALRGLREDLDIATL